MCGIAGFVDYKKKSDLDILKNMTDILYHRGPDFGGYEIIKEKKAIIALGHRRLSILDLSHIAHQPMHYKDVSLIAYNGEIYNFKEIRKELEKEGYDFISNSDTEVILKAFDRWGIETINRFNGMFAFALYLKKEKKLFLVRDRSGIKPLYYYYKDSVFLFSSELKSFHQFPSFEKKIDINALSLYFQYGYISEPHTIFKDTCKLKSGHYIEFDIDKESFEIKKYWDVFDFYNKEKLELGEKEIITHTESLFESAFNYRLIADVKVGVFLSGGYDSSALTAVLQKDKTDKIKTFTIGFYEEGFNEANYAKEVASYLGTNHTEYYCTQKEALDIIPSLCRIYDEPFSDASSIPTILVSRIAKENVTVALSADGADEVFGGYDMYKDAMRYKETIEKIMPLFQKMLSKSMSLIDPSKIPYLKNYNTFPRKYEKLISMLDHSDIENIFSQVVGINTLKDTRAVLKKDFIPLEIVDTDFLKEEDDFNRLLAIHYKTFLNGDILTKTDRASMSVSLEAREPLLDYRIIEFMARIDSKHKFKYHQSKYILKEIVHKYIPKKIMQRPKQGFNIPLERWLRNDLKEYLRNYLDPVRLQEEQLLNVQKVSEIYNAFLRGKSEYTELLWQILIFEMWYEEWLKS